MLFRSLISNGCDAILKFQKLCDIGEASNLLNEPFKVTVTLNTTNKTLTFSDNGIGMTADEIEKYITQIAFSGAEDFLAQYKDKMDQDQIIGHFGLGFYSAFMVAEQVVIDTLSYKDSKAIKWTCDGGTTYELSEGTRTTRGTSITLFITEESNTFLNFYELKQAIEKYCSFMPVPVYVIDEEKEAEEATAHAKKIEEAHEKGEALSDEELAPIVATPINDSHPDRKSVV